MPYSTFIGGVGTSSKTIYSEKNSRDYVYEEG